MSLKLEADSMAGLVKQLQVCGIIKNKKVADVMKLTDRKLYCPAPNPYVDKPERIAECSGISAPDVHALALEALAEFIKPDSIIMDLGAGSGYLTACFAKLIEMKAKELKVKPSGRVIGIDIQDNVLRLAQDNIRKDDTNLIKKRRIIMLEGDGKYGCEEFAPYDIIYVGAAVPETPVELLLQLKINGHLLTPVIADDGKQYLMQFIKKTSGEVVKKVISPVEFDPMIITDQSMVGAEDVASHDPNEILNDDKIMNGDEDADEVVMNDADEEDTMTGIIEGIKETKKMLPNNEEVLNIRTGRIV
uniref:protein-L-isoaspartate(D-aspartate) O-methyltransferase n=1 Tax=Polypedilum vanderplanki TaxID=319348 RepID=S6CDF4_POLVA|nr:protein L-isoaspartyl methyltransferase [Polypedilum vanderplanki]